MRNNLTGIIISALLHVALFSWALAVNTDPVKPYSSQNIALTVKMFQEVIAPPVPAPIIKKVAKKVTPPTPLNPEFADLPSPPKAKPEPEPRKIAKVEPKILPLPELAKLEPIPELVKPKPAKVIKPKIIKKVVIKKKAIIAKKTIKIVKKKVAKKAIPRKITKKKIVKQRKVAKKKVIRKQVKRKVVQKRPKVIKRKLIAKAKPRKQAKKRPIKRRVVQQKSKKVGGVYSKNQLKRQQLARQRALAARKAAIQRKQAQQASLKKSPSVVATNSKANVTLTKQFKARLQRLIASNKHYPKRAKRRGQQGKVTVSFHIRHSGIISDIRIVKGARNKSLNQATIAAIKKASGKLAYPKGMNKKSLTLTVTLSYVLS